MASGGGFRDWTPETAQQFGERLAAHLRTLETILGQNPSAPGGTELVPDRDNVSRET